MRRCSIPSVGHLSELGSMTCEIVEISRIDDEMRSDAGTTRTCLALHDLAPPSCLDGSKQARCCQPSISLFPWQLYHRRYSRLTLL